MTKVLIQPCANAEARRNWHKTMDVESDFADGALKKALTDQQFKRLIDLHPAGRAQFWGTADRLDDAMATVGTGDVVLFSWKHYIRAVGEVGASFRNQDFADALWREDGDAKSFVNVYSLLGLVSVQFPYSDVTQLGLRGNLFRQGHVLSDPAVVEAILETLGIETATEVIQRQESESTFERRLSLEVERMHKSTGSYQTQARTIVVRRGESELVQEFQRANPEVKFMRSISAAGITDLHSEESGGIHLIEAKGGSSRARVREAVAQLLQYAPEHRNVTTLSALFPDLPKSTDVRFLHNLGIDCIVRIEPGKFETLSAPSARRAHMLPVWNNEV